MPMTPGAAFPSGLYSSIIVAIAALHPGSGFGVAFVEGSPGCFKRTLIG